MQRMKKSSPSFKRALLGRVIIGAAVVGFAASPVYAQSSEPSILERILGAAGNEAADVAKEKASETVGAGEGSVGDVVTDTVLTEVEKRILGKYYQDKKSEHDDDDDDDRDDDDDKKKGKKDKGKGKSKGLPPGLAKKDELPPGLAMQLEKNGRLPPGLAKRDLPDDLKERLPERDDNTEIVEVGADVVLVEKGTQIVLDVLEGVIRDATGTNSN